MNFPQTKVRLGLRKKSDFATLFLLPKFHTKFELLLTDIEILQHVVTGKFSDHLWYLARKRLQTPAQEQEGQRPYSLPA